MTKETQQELIRQLTVEDKISLQTGRGNWNTASVESLGVRSVTMNDGPVGLRKETHGATLPSVCFPSVAKLACSFDTALLTKVGAAIGEQCRAENVNVLLAPGINIKRDPRCGRNFEYFSEDPLLTAELANAYIAGINSQGVGACVKHFAANNQEYGRMVVDSVVDERALREIYLNAFERVIKQSKPCAVMCAYNKLNGEYCSQNKRLLTDILRGEWKYDGAVISDWGATDDRVKGLQAGLNLEMPQGDTLDVKRALSDGTLDIECLDSSVARVVELSEKFSDTTERTVDFDKQRAFVRKISAETTTLVKNNCNLLPLNKTDKIAVIGELAEKPVFQGDGSSKVNADNADNFIAALRLGNVDFRYCQGYSLYGETDEGLIEEARQAATESDKVVLIVGDKPDCEGRDRKSWTLPASQLKLIDAVTSANGNVVIVLQCGSAVNVDFVHSAKAMLIDYYGGEQSGHALFDVLFGDVCPSGRLAETWYSYLPKYGENFSKEYKRVLYKESIFVGYRYATTANVPVAFPFGYGLSYNDIKWSAPELSRKDAKKEKISVSLTLTNTGDKADADVVQIYSTNVDGRGFYERKKLVAFSKVNLKAGESKDITVSIPIGELAHYDVDKERFTVNGGKYLLTVGKNADDDRFVLEYVVEGDNDTADVSDKYPCYYSVDEDFAPTDEEFLALYGKQLDGDGTKFHKSVALDEVKNSFVGKIMIKKLTRSCDEEAKRNTMALPLRAFVSDSLSRDMLDTLIDMLNGAVFKNLFKLYKQHLACKKAQRLKKKNNK